MNKIKIFSVGAIAAFVAIGIYSFRPLPDERLFRKQQKLPPAGVTPMAAPVYESALPYNYVPGNTSGSKALK